MSSTQSQAPPEARGAGRYDESGAVRYGGDEPQVRARLGRIPPRREPPTDPQAPANVVPHQAGYGCQRCHGIPDGVLAPLQQALGGQR